MVAVLLPMKLPDYIKYITNYVELSSNFSSVVTPNDHKLQAGERIRLTKLYEPVRDKTNNLGF